MVKTTTEEYINRVKDLHYIKYDYSKTTFNGYKNNLIVICPEHGEFEVNAYNHQKLNHGCVKCTGVGKINNHLEFFIEKANKIHDNKYDYSLIKEYKGVMKKYPIICHKHGIWEVSLDNHINKKSSCPKCKGRTLSYLEKIEQANKIHNNQYDYSLIKENFKSDEKILIVCPTHGKFNQLWTNHIHQKHGCPKCKTCGRKSISIDELKERIYELNTGYEYNWDTYKGYYDNMFEIKCNKHGWFKQQISNHLQGQKCPKCKNSRGEENIRKFLNEQNISYIEQKTFDFCVNPKTNYLLKFDFYIPHLNLCIEYDGELHFKPVKFFGGIKSYEKQIYLDGIKNKFCEDNKINLLRISFIQFNDIEKILKKII